MKFHIFRWWEIWAKPVLYTFVLLLTGGLFALYFNVNDKDGYFAFVISIIYALFLFLITIPINRIDAYTADKLYEREGYYLALKRLREVTNSTIQKINVNDVKDFAIKIGSFQIFTGRDEESCQRRVAGERVPIYAKEKGFEYTAKMLRLETEFLKISSIENEKKILRKGKALKKYYIKNCKKLEKNYSKISSIYGGALQELIERDSLASDADYSLNDINSKIDDLVSEITSLRADIDEITDLFGSQQKEIADYCAEIGERLSDIEMSIFDMTENT